MIVELYKNNQLIRRKKYKL